MLCRITVFRRAQDWVSVSDGSRTDMEVSSRVLDQKLQNIFGRISLFWSVELQGHPEQQNGVCAMWADPMVRRLGSDRHGWLTGGTSRWRMSPMGRLNGSSVTRPDLKGRRLGPIRWGVGSARMARSYIRRWQRPSAPPAPKFSRYVFLLYTICCYLWSVRFDHTLIPYFYLSVLILSLLFPSLSCREAAPHNAARAPGERCNIHRGPG